MTENLGQRAARGTVWSIGGQGISTVISFVTMMVLARLLVPEQFGLVAMVTVIMGIGDLVRDFGLTRATIQAPSLSAAESNNLFWLNTILATGVALILWAGAGVVADFYSRSELVAITQVLSINLILSGLSTQPRALLIRDLRMNTIAVIEVMGAVVALITGISMAMAGLGYWSIVGMQIARNLFSMIAVFIKAKLIPRIPDRTVSIRHFARFGLSLFGSQAVIYASSSIDSVLIGRFIGPVSLGYYSRALQLSKTPIQGFAAPISNLAISILSKLRDQKNKYEYALTQGQTALMSATTLGYAILIVYADFVIRIVLGPSWEASIIPFQILCISAAVQSAHHVTYWIYVTEGIPSRYFQLSLVTRTVLLVVIALAVPFGINAVATAIAIWTVAYWPASTWWVGKHSDISVGPILTSGARIVVTSTVITLAGLLARSTLNSRGLTSQIISGALGMAAAATLCLLIIPGLRQQLRKMVELVPLTLPSRNA